MPEDPAAARPGRGARAARALGRAALTVALAPPIARLGDAVATTAGLAWGLALARGSVRVDERGIVVVTGMPTWSFGRGGTCVGSVYLTSDNDSASVLDHEAVHAAQWRRFGLAFIPLYLAAGRDAHRNRFEVEAGLEAGGYAGPGPRPL